MRPEPDEFLRQIDWSVLLFFAGLFIIVGGVEGSGLLDLVGQQWWALALGVGLGGNGTHIGSAASVICVAEAERAGIPECRSSPMLWLKMGTPVMPVTLLVSSVLLTVFFDYYRGG